MDLSFSRQILFTVGVVLLAGQVEAGSFDGAWTASLDRTFGGPECDGFVLDKVRIVDGKLTGGVNHTAGGYFALSGSIAPDGTLRNAVASGVV